MAGLGICGVTIARTASQIVCPHFAGYSLSNPWRRSSCRRLPTYLMLDCSMLKSSNDSFFVEEFANSRNASHMGGTVTTNYVSSN
jgi:hypothetical protein